MSDVFSTSCSVESSITTMATLHQRRMCWKRPKCAERTQHLGFLGGESFGRRQRDRPKCAPVQTAYSFGSLFRLLFFVSCGRFGMASWIASYTCLPSWLPVSEKACRCMRLSMLKLFQTNILLISRSDVKSIHVKIFLCLRSLNVLFFSVHLAIRILYCSFERIENLVFYWLWFREGFVAWY